MNLRCRIVVAGVVAGLLTASATSAQTAPPPRPVPFPTAGAPATTAATDAPQAPAEGTLGAPIYPAAVFLESLDAGKGQRYHLYGTDAPFADIVNYYKTTLKNGGRTLASRKERLFGAFDVGEQGAALRRQVFGDVHASPIALCPGGYNAAPRSTTTRGITE